MTTYAAFHAFIMWGFYSLGCVIVALLLLSLAAWLNHRWQHRSRTPRRRRPNFQPENLNDI